ncbi:hypothetical protein ABPG73_011431, partial [Tetrahymena malaccensis]
KTQIGNQGLQSLGINLPNCKNISTLRLGLIGNNICDEGISCLSFSQINKLDDLSLALNENSKITNKGISDLGLCLSNCYNLSTLKLYLYNQNLKCFIYWQNIQMQKDQLKQQMRVFQGYGNSQQIALKSLNQTFHQ